MAFEVFARTSRRGGFHAPVPKIGGACPTCDGPLPLMPPSQARTYCSRRCLGIAKRGVPLGKRPGSRPDVAASNRAHPPRLGVKSR